MLDAVLVKEYLSVSFRAKVEKWERDLSKNQTPLPLPPPLPSNN